MKKIKLFCGILIGLMILSSCSSNENSDEESNPERISIVGIWKPIQRVEICSTGNEETYDFSICEQMSRITFYLNGELNITEYKLVDGNCDQDYTENGTWIINNDNLSTTFSVDTDEFTILELSSNTLKFGSDSDPSNLCDGGNLPSHFYTVFTKVI